MVSSPQRFVRGRRGGRRRKRFRPGLQTPARFGEFCMNRLNGRQAGASITLDAYFARLQELRSNENSNAEILNALEAYALELCKI